VVLLDPDENVQAWLRVSVADNSFTASLRGVTKESCVRLMKTITDQITLTAAAYGGVRWEEALRSPFSLTGLLTVRAVQSDITQPGHSRTLQCPETHFPLRAESLLHIGGYRDVDEREQGQTWWEAIFEFNRPERGGGGSLGISVVADGSPVHQRLYELLISLLEKMEPGVSTPHFSSAYAIDNPVLALTVSNALQLLSGKLADTRSLFRKEDWKREPHQEQRRDTLLHMGDYLGRFRREGWNDGRGSPIIPMVQKMPARLAWAIAKYGFGVLPISGGGAYGQGIYFTRSLRYANFCSTTGEEDNEEWVYLLSLVIPGNPFPVVERPTDASGSYVGRSCRPGYQSHYVLVHAVGESAGMPVEVLYDEETSADELVIPDPSHALPLFMLGMHDFDFSLGEPTRGCLVRREWAVSLGASDAWVDLDLASPSAAIPAELAAQVLPEPPSLVRKLMTRSREVIPPDSCLVLAMERGRVVDEGLYSAFQHFLPFLGINGDQVNKVYWICNPTLTTLFQAARESIAVTHRISPGLFRRQEWRDKEDAERRQESMQFLEALTRALLGPSDPDGGMKELMVPMLQGTSENAAHRIAKNGFGTVASLDLGWFGQGIYFTSRMPYACEYAELAKDGRVFLLSVVVPGNAYPVTETPFIIDQAQNWLKEKIENPEGLFGRPCRPGYQSHYVIVDTKSGLPDTRSVDQGSEDELVVFQPSQVLPLFFFYSDQKREYPATPEGSILDVRSAVVEERRSQWTY